MNRGVLIAAMAIMSCSIATLGGAQSASQLRDWPASLRLLLGDFTSDSMRNRPIGSQVHARAIGLLWTELDAVAQRSNGRLANSVQVVPFETVTPDPIMSKVVGSRTLAFGTDYVPLSGYGLEPPDVTDVQARFISLGRLGADIPGNLGAAKGQFVLVLPPHRPDGEPEYQLNAVAAYLRPLEGAAAVFVTSRDLMPRNFIDRMLRPRLVLKGVRRHEGATPNGSPVVIATTRSMAGHLASADPDKLGTARIIFARDSLAYPSPNLIAVLPGSDPARRDEFVVLVAHTDTYASEDSAAAASSVSLLAIAEHLVASEVPLHRSVLFLWTSGYDRGQLGLRHFLDARASSPTSIAAIVSIDALGAPTGGQVSGDPYAADGCNSVLAQAAARGIAAVSVSSHADSAFVPRAFSTVQGLANAGTRARPANAPRSISCPPY